MVDKNKVSKGVLFGIIGVSCLVIIIVVLAAVLYFNAPKKVKKEKLEGGNIYYTYSDDICGLEITKFQPFTDADGKKINQADMYFDFSVASEMDEANEINYEISITSDKKTTVPLKNVKVYLEKQSSGTYVPVGEPKTVSLSKETSKLGSPANSMVIHTETKKKSITDNYRLRAWVSKESGATLTDKDILSLRVSVSGKAS
ncbi:MAG: hypothetical protein IJ193_06050 [Bacilli bacterium]|nr:hypothetical protein [Bacilli bacterium]